MNVLLCEPTHYELRYAINPWMMGPAIDVPLARKQFDHLVEVYTSLGFNLYLLEPNPDLPDMVFTANAGLMVGDGFVPSNFRYPERSPEADLFAAFFSMLGRPVHRLDPAVVFEGTGDALYLGRELVLAHGFRSERRVCQEIAKLGFPEELIVSVGLCNPYFYHLDTCFSPLPSGRFIYYPDAFDDQSRMVLEARAGYWVTEALCTHYGCNLVAVDDVLVTSWADARLHEIAKREGLRIVEVPVSEFVKAGGGVRCLSFFFDSQNPEKGPVLEVSHE